MPMDRSKYPDDWEQISLEVRNRAGWCCQHCGAQNDRIIARYRKDPEQFRYVDYGEMEERAIDAAPDRYFLPPVRVVLTVHHIGVDKPDGTPGDPHDKMDNRPENLIALCQRCHLLADQNTHIADRRRNRIIRQRQAGQMDLFEE